MKKNLFFMKEKTFSRATKILVENGVLLFLTECGAVCSLRTCLDFYVFFVSVSTYFYPRGIFTIRFVWFVFGPTSRTNPKCTVPK